MSIPSSCLPSLPALQGDTKAFPSQLRCVLGLPWALLLLRHAWNTSPRRHPGVRCPNHLNSSGPFLLSSFHIKMNQETEISKKIYIFFLKSSPLTVFSQLSSWPQRISSVSKPLPRRGKSLKTWSRLCNTSTSWYWLKKKENKKILLPDESKFQISGSQRKL